MYIVLFFQMEISKRLNTIIGQILPFLSQEHQQQVASTVERAKQITVTELNNIVGVSIQVTSNVQTIFRVFFKFSKSNLARTLLFR